MRGRCGLVIATTIAVLMSGCGSPDVASSIGGDNSAEVENELATEAAQRIPKSTLNHEHDKFVQLSPVYRHIALTRAINAAGGVCNVVDRAFYQGMAKSMHASIWSAHCQPGSDWRVTLDEDGEFRAMECSQSSVACWQRL